MKGFKLNFDYETASDRARRFQSADIDDMSTRTTWRRRRGRHVYVVPNDIGDVVGNDMDGCRRGRHLECGRSALKLHSGL